MKALEQKTLKFIQENNLIQDNENILVAFSGGPDSVFLLTILNKFSNLLKIKVFAAHINHNLRGSESESDQKFCHSFCSILGIGCFSRSVDVNNFSSENKISIEEAARELRYDALKEIAKKCNCSKIATAHNIGDNAETMLFNFLKGTGIAGLKGIPIQRENIIRPILNIHKDDILEYLKEENIKYVVDSSNLENDYKRNFVRNEIVPLIKNNINPSFESALLNSSMILSSAEKIIDKHLEVFIKTFVEIKTETVEIRDDFFKTEEFDLFGELLKRVVKRSLFSDLTFTDIKTIINLVSNYKGAKNYLSGGLIVVREKDRIVIGRQSDEELPPPMIVKPDNTYKIYDFDIQIEKIINQEKLSFSEDYELIDFNKLDGDLILRPWIDGDKFRPLGMDGFKKVADFLSEQNIDSGSKREQLVLENNGNIVWVVGLRVDDRYKITNGTDSVLKLRIL